MELPHFYRMNNVHSQLVPRNQLKTLNRLSWLRCEHSFLNKVIVLPETRWVIFYRGQPLVASNAADQRKLCPAYLLTEDVKRFLGPEPFFGQGKETGQLVPDSSDLGSSPTAAMRHQLPSIVFLGYGADSLDAVSPPSGDLRTVVEKFHGIPYFTVDFGELDVSEETIAEFLRNGNSLVQPGCRLHWSEPRSFMTMLDAFNGALHATARSMLYWNQTNKFCPACGSPTYSMWAGWKRSCSSLLPWFEKPRQKACPTIKGIQNLSHPRTDVVVVVIVTNIENDKILLGRGKKYPAGNHYSALSGFVEPGETFEDAVTREVLEETGLRVWDVRYSSNKEWPYPSNLLIGFYARANAEQPIRLDLDSVRWCTRSEVRTVLEHPTGSLMGSDIYQSMAQNTEGRNYDPSDISSIRRYRHSGNEISPGDLPFRVPPETLLPGALIRRWAYDDESPDPPNAVRREVRERARKSNL